ncbi:MAG: protein-export chaperone SecB [Candidatus Rariloculaceae bacterium]
MAEEKQTDAGKQLVLQKIYIKDLSFESPRAPEVFGSNVTPQTRLNIKSSAKEVAAETHEVVLTLTVEAVDEDKTLFVVEIDQAGLFRMQGYSQEELQMLIGSYCPGTLYPFAREAISDVITRGGFPQLLLQPINFDALYAQAAKEQGESNGESAKPSTSTH